jgi:hypothetical protein
MSLARFLLLLINNNSAKCFRLSLSKTCVFFNGLFYNWRYTCRCPTLILSPSLSLSLSLCYLALLPSSFWYKRWFDLVLSYQLNKCICEMHCSHFKGNINTKLLPFWLSSTEGSSVSRDQPRLSFLTSFVPSFRNYQKKIKKLFHWVPFPFLAGMVLHN